MPRKVSHSRNIFTEDVVGKKYIPGDIIQFNYKGDDIYDRIPTVFVLKRNDMDKTILGLNINYLSEYKVSILLEEKNYKKMRYWNFYEKAYRTYSINKMTMIKSVTYKTNKMLSEERKQRRESNEQ
ncbi:hypothetical protein CL614_10600 [archaeon]|jgi:hypothetical protein|nr:hypothetical protein [archaeon]|tara:strand:- start:444 stop:821 length:378 start_codon:yes stop_codon:yes gene_type:complete